MAFLEWDEKLSVGVHQLDAEHRGMIDRINEAHQALLDNRPKREIGTILEHLVQETKAHFRAEEIMLLHAEYPETEAHRKEHDALAEWAVLTQLEFEHAEKDGLSLEDLDKMKAVFIQHLMTSDQLYVEHLVDKSAK